MQTGQQLVPNGTLLRSRQAPHVRLPLFVSVRKCCELDSIYKRRARRMADPLSVVLLGAGLFARDAYLPLLRFAW